MAYDTILYDTAPDGVATITLNRPEALNSFNKKMCAEFVDVWARVRKDPAVKAVVLRAAGDRAFCTGVDVKSMTELPDPGVGPFGEVDPGEYLGPKSNHMFKPVIAAVHGMCAGGAFYWINECDIVICSEEAHFFDPHVSFGMVCAVEPTGLLSRMPYMEVVRMALMGNDERISAETAKRFSLVTEITKREDLWSRAHEIGAAIASKPSAAIEGTVRVLWEARDMPPSMAITNSYRFTQIGNHLGQAEVNRATAPKAKWRLR